jgi:hypothetical protein
MRLLVALLLATAIFSGCLELEEKVEELEKLVNVSNLEVTPTSHPGGKKTSEESVIPVNQTPIESLESTYTETTGKVDLLTNMTLITPDFCKDEIIWRYSLEKSIYCALNQKELFNIFYLALELRGEDVRESAWNILDWENETIEYDWEKASLPPPELIYWSDGKVEVVRGKENIIQTPTETIQRKKGVCSDYAILTAALLLGMGYQPVYLFDIKFENYDLDHATAAIRIDGHYFTIDQRPPILDLGSYYKKWAKYEEFGNKKISSIAVYQVMVEENRIEVVSLGNLTAEEIKQFDYILKEEDLEAIGFTMMIFLEKNFPSLKKDENLKDLDKRKYLPPGYRDGGSWKVRFSYFAEYYNPLFHSQFTEYLLDQMLRGEIVKDLKNSNRFWIKVQVENSDLSVILYFARR